jgi:uncharacterized protein (TIGR02217 family)
VSNQVFPNLLGLDIQTKWTPRFLSLSQVAVSGAEQRIALRQYPIYDISLKFEMLRSAAAYAELQNLMGFIMQRQGSFDSFLWTNPEDNTATAQGIGIGNGSNTVFQLNRAWGGFVEPVMNLNTITDVQVSGVSVSYTLGALGVVTLATAPAASAPVTWDGTYYYRCRFADDAIEFERFLWQYWQAGKVDMIGCLGNKIP